MTQEQPKPTQEKKEQVKEIQRLELDPDKKVDIVIKKIPGENLYYEDEEADPWNRGKIKYLPAQVVIEQDGKTIIDFEKDIESIKLYFTKDNRGEWLHLNRLYDDGELIGVTCMPNKWRDNEDILSFLHEVGHALHSLDNIDRSKKSVGLYNKSMKKEREEKGDAINLLDASKELKKSKSEHVRLSAKSERGAWAKGLDLVRKFKREKGIDLLKPFKGKTPKETRENLEAHVHNRSLRRYEESVRQRIIEQGFSGKLRGLFEKKYSDEDEKELAEELKKERAMLD